MQKLLIVTQFFNIVINDFDAKKSAGKSQMLIVTERLMGGLKCILADGYSSFTQEITKETGCTKYKRE